MKPKNIGNWLKDNLERMATEMDPKDLDDFEVRLKRIRKRKEKEV